MRIKEICLEPFEIQSKIIYERAVYIGKEKVNGKYHVLFQLDGFYIEIIYESYRRKIEKINYSTLVSTVERYLPELNIEVFVNAF